MGKGINRQAENRKGGRKKKDKITNMWKAWDLSSSSGSKYQGYATDVSLEAREGFLHFLRLCQWGIGNNDVYVFGFLSCNQY